MFLVATSKSYDISIFNYVNYDFFYCRCSASHLNRHICYKSSLNYFIDSLGNNHNNSPLLTKLVAPTFFVQKQSMFIKVQETPNPNSLKFVPGVQVSLAENYK